MTQPLKFYELPAEEQAAITKAIVTGSAKIKVYNNVFSFWQLEENIKTSDFHLERCYRLQPKKLDIPWDIIDKKYNYAVLEKDGSVWFGHEEFTACVEEWDEYWDMQKWYVQSCLNIDTVGIDYKTSQTKRP